MTTFLLKIHCRHDLGGANPLPKKASEWEGARIAFRRPTHLTGGHSEEVTDGDTVMVWTHQGKQHGGGYGLTAKGIARNVGMVDRETRFATLTDVILLKPHYGLRGWEKGMSAGSAVGDRILENFHRNTYLLTAEQLSEFMAVVDRHAHYVNSHNVSLARTDEELAVDENRDEIKAEFERRYSRQELRPEQARFRAELLKRYGGRCAVSGCNLEATLQAAHVIPFSKNVALRNAALNGLLLRADIHSLFDRALLSIHPESCRVVLSRKIAQRDYVIFAHRVVDPAPAQPYLRAQFSFFESKEQESAE